MLFAFYRVFKSMELLSFDSPCRTYYIYIIVIIIIKG